MNNFGVTTIKNKRNFNNNITVLLKTKDITFENVKSNWGERIIIYLLHFVVLLLYQSQLNQKRKLLFILLIRHQ